MAKEWNGLEYSSAEPKDNTLTVEATGATYDSSSQTIKWHSGDTFILKFKPEEALKETNKNTSIYDEPISDALDYFDGYKFLFAAYSLYGAKTEPMEAGQSDGPVVICHICSLCSGGASGRGRCL